MTVKLPEFKRCCFCVPLRDGLLAWGYFKIIADALICHFLAYAIIVLLVFGDGWSSDKTKIRIVSDIVMFVMFVTDFVASIVFTVGALAKNFEQIRRYYSYSIAMLIVTALLIVLGVLFSIYSWFSGTNPLESLLHTVFLALVILVVQAYFILLLRSEVNRLNRCKEIKLVNNPAEA